MTRKIFLATLCSFGLAGAALLSPAVASADTAPVPPVELIDPETGVTEIYVGMSVDDIESDGSFAWTPMVGRAAGTYNYSGSFKASLESAKIGHAGGDITITAKPTGCTPGYGKIYIQLVKTWAGAVTDMSPKVAYTCGALTQYTWTGRSGGTYNAYFSRSGPTGIDENTKSVSGAIKYQK